MREGQIRAVFPGMDDGAAEGRRGIVEHGFTKDRKRHSIDIRVVHKGDDVILRIRDDCVPFDPGVRQRVFDPSDIMKNVGIRIAYTIARDINYQNIMGLNVLTLRI